MAHTDPGRRRVRIFAFAIAAAFGIAALVSWISSIEDLRAGSRSLGTPEERLEVESVPTRYTAVFRVEDRAGAEPNITTEKVWMERPFSSRTETWTGPPPGDERLSVLQSSFGILSNRGKSADPLNLAVPPSLGSGDLRMDAVLDRAVADDMLVPMELREVYGRECQVYRAGGPVFAGDIVAFDEDSATFADVCIDANGLVIEEVWTQEERIIRRRIAEEISIDPPLDDALFESDVPVQEGGFRGTVERVREAETTGLWRLPEPPEGFRDLGLFAVTLPEAVIPQVSPLVETVAPSSVTQVYVDGPDLLVVDQDPSLAQFTRNEGRATQPVEIDGLADAVLILDARLNEVRGIDAEGSVVRIFGTIAPDELVALARKLEAP